jgi:hypothetical protein
MADSETARLPVDFFIAVNSGQAKSVSPDGSTFVVEYTPPLEISNEAKNVSVALIQGTFWWTIPNIEACTLLMSVYDQKTGVYTDIPVFIPRGLYTFKQINLVLANASTTRGYEDAILQFVNNGATSTLDLAFSVPAKIRFPTNSCWKQLGYLPEVDYIFNSEDPPSQFQMAPNQAEFDTIQYLTVGTSLVDLGFQLIGGLYRGVIAHVGITAAPGFQIVNTPSVPLDVSSTLFSTPGGIGRAEFYLMDQDGVLVNTNGQTWSLLLRIRYYL